MATPRMTPVFEVHDDNLKDDPSELFTIQRRLRSGPYQEPLPQPQPQPQQPIPMDHETLKYTRLVKDDISSKIMGVPKHVFKVKEVTKLLLFVGLAASSIVLLDVSAKFLIAMAKRGVNRQ